jgi:hypothetical protein
MPPEPASHDPGGTLHLRPHGATVLCLVVGLVGLGLLLDAVVRAGWQGVLLLPVPLLLLSLVWLVLWAPRVVLHEDSVEVRNVLVTHHLPFAAIQDVRLGAMLRFEVVTRRGDRTMLTAWNAPALGRDAPWRRQAMLHEQDLRGRRLTPQERLVHDQQRSRSAVIEQRWERWLERRDEPGRQGAHAREQADGDTAVMATRVNVPQITVVAILSVLVAVRVLV